MRFDVENQLSTAQSFTAGPAVSTDAYQKSTAAQDLSIARRVCLGVFPTIAAGAGSTVTVEAIQADDAALTSNVQQLGVASFAAARFVPGAELEVPIPQYTMTKQFLGARVTIAGGTNTATADIYIMVLDEMGGNQFKSFPKAFDAGV